MSASPIMHTFLTASHTIQKSTPSPNFPRGNPIQIARFVLGREGAAT